MYIYIYALFIAALLSALRLFFCRRSVLGSSVDTLVTYGGFAIGIFRGPLLRGPHIISLHIFIQPYLAQC